MQFIKGRRKDFKTEDAYLTDIFEKNREAITSAYGANALERFKNQVRSYKILNNNMTVKAAIKKIERSRAFTPYKYIAAENVKKQMIEYDKWRQFQNLTRDHKGRFTKYDPKLLHYDRDTKSYIYDGRVRISFKNSPEGIIITLI